MSICCEKIGVESKILGEVCQEIEKRYNKRCEDMDASVPYVDYTTLPYTTKDEPPNGATELSEIMWWAFKYAKEEYLSDYSKRIPIGADGSFIDYLTQRGLRPFWVVSSQEVLDVVRQLIKVGDQKTTFNNIFDYFTRMVTFIPIPDNNVQYPDETIKRGRAACLAWSAGLYGLLILGGITATMAEDPASKLPFFHIGTNVTIGTEEKTILPNKEILEGHQLEGVTELSTLAFFMSESVFTGERDIEWLKLAHKIAPHDYRITYNIGILLEKIGHNDEAKKWFEETKRLNLRF